MIPEDYVTQKELLAVTSKIEKLVSSIEDIEKSVDSLVKGMDSRIRNFLTFTDASQIPMYPYMQYPNVLSEIQNLRNDVTFLKTGLTNVQGEVALKYNVTYYTPPYIGTSK